MQLRRLGAVFRPESRRRILVRRRHGYFFFPLIAAAFRRGVRRFVRRFRPGGDAERNLALRVSAACQPDIARSIPEAEPGETDGDGGDEEKERRNERERTRRKAGFSSAFRHAFRLPFFPFHRLPAASVCTFSAHARKKISLRHILRPKRKIRQLADSISPCSFASLHCCNFAPKHILLYESRISPAFVFIISSFSPSVNAF